MKFGFPPSTVDSSCLPFFEYASSYDLLEPLLMVTSHAAMISLQDTLPPCAYLT